MTGLVLEDLRVLEGCRCIDSSIARIVGLFAYTSCSFLSSFVSWGWVGKLVLFIVICIESS